MSRPLAIGDRVAAPAAAHEHAPVSDPRRRLQLALADDEAPDRKDLRTLARELVPGFLDRLAQRGVAGQRLAADPDRARRHVHVDLAHPGQLADLAPNGRGTVLAAHPRHHHRTRLHPSDPTRRGRLIGLPAAAVLCLVIAVGAAWYDYRVWTFKARRFLL
jgi:hypothetical protein